jgi:hypothetical protein
MAFQKTRNAHELIPQNGVGNNKYPIMSPVITEKLKGEFDKVG